MLTRNQARKSFTVFLLCMAFIVPYTVPSALGGKKVLPKGVSHVAS